MKKTRLVRTVKSGFLLIGSYDEHDRIFYGVFKQESDAKHELYRLQNQRDNATDHRSLEILKIRQVAIFGGLDWQE